MQKTRPGPSDESPSAREQLIADALAVRKSREVEWNALTPAQRSRAVAALGNSMEAIVKTFRAA